MSHITDIDLDRLLKLIGLFGSEHEGERANAAALATRMLRDVGLTWEEFLDRISAAPPALVETPLKSTFRYTAYDHVEAADLCLLHGRGLSRWEKKFLESVQDFRRLSNKQQDVLARVCAKCRVDWP